MAELSRFFADVAGDRLTTAAQWNRIFDQLLQEKDGVIRGLGNTLAVTNAGTVSADVNTGSAIMGGRLYENTASKNLVLDAVTSGSKRYDRIVVRVDETARTMLLTVIKGVEGASPAVPAIDGTTDVLLAKILLDRSSGSYAYTVTDERVYCDGLLLPAIIAILNATPPTAAGITDANAIGSGVYSAGTKAHLQTQLPIDKALADAEVTQTLWDFTKAVKMPPNLLREMVEAASAGAATVKHDDLGFPSMMYIIRGPILAGHIHADMGGTTVGVDEHPAFKVNGVAKNEIFISMFKATSFNGTTYHGSGAGYRAVSWPGLMPTGSLDFDASKAIHTQKGTGWHMMSMWERALIMWISMKMNTEPRGNTYYGRSHESGYEYECAVRSDGLAPGYVGGTAKHRNGSGPSKWSHNGERWGIHDLVGSMYEWTDLIKLVDGLIKMPNDNNFTLAEASWPSQGVYLDNTAAGSGGAPRLNASLVNALTDPNYSSVTHNALTMTAEYDALDLAVRQRMLAAGISPKIASGGTNPWSPKGTLYMRNFGERLPHCGGGWHFASNAGLAYLDLGDLRSVVSGSIGSRSAFISLS